MACFKKKRNTKWDNVGKDVIVVHALKRTDLIPNLSPFVLKLETYLRMAELKYEFDSSATYGPKGKTPWITLNGEDFGDSQLIIEMLSDQLSKDLNAHLTVEEKAISKSFAIMVDEHMFWGMLWWRLVKDPQLKIVDLLGFPKFMKHIFPFVMGRKIKGRLEAQGLGSHNDQELINIIKRDIKAVSDFLGVKNFLLGNEVCEADCSLFGVLAQFVYATPGSPFTEYMQDESLKNLTDYCDRIRDKYWPDWEELLVKPLRGN